MFPWICRLFFRETQHFKLGSHTEMRNSPPMPATAQTVPIKRKKRKDKRIITQCANSLEFSSLWSVLWLHCTREKTIRKMTVWGMQIVHKARITNALFSEPSAMIYERCSSLWEDNAIWNGSFHKSILLVPSWLQTYYELLNPIMFSSSIDKKGLCLERGNDAVTERRQLRLCLQGFRLAMARQLRERRNLYTQNERIIKTCSIPNVFLLVEALIIGRP